MADAETHPGQEQKEAVMSIVHQWGSLDIAEASAWVEQFPPGDFRERATRELQCIEDRQEALPISSL